MRYVHTNIIAKDWKSLVSFYTKTFECVVVPPVRNQSGEWLDQGTGVKNAHLEGAHLLLPGYGKNGPTLEIYSYSNIEDQEKIMPNKRGFGHIAFEVLDVQAVVENVLKNGGQLLGQITEKKVEGIGKITFVYVRDPEGNIIELQNWDRI